MMQQHLHSDTLLLAGGITVLIMMLLPVNVTASSAPNTDTLLMSAVPTPELEPADVVRIQVEALRNNSPLDEGIELTYRFASPANKQVTGPLIRFTAMVNASPYDRLLNHQRASYEPLAIAGDMAHQLVSITDTVGEEITYHWVLVRLSEGPYKDCWMTDAVIPTSQPVLRILTQDQSVFRPVWQHQASNYTLLEVAHAR